MAAAVEGQHPALQFGVPQAGDGLWRLAELAAVIDQAHFRIGVGNGVDLAVMGDAGNFRVIAEAPELAGGVLDACRLQRLQQLQRQ